MRPCLGRAGALLATVAFTAAVLQASTQGTARGSQPRTRSAQRPAPREAVVPFRVGETLTYDVAWSQFLVAGTAVSRVAERRTSSAPAYYLVAEGRPLPIIARLYALYYKMDSLLDTVSLLSHRTSLYQEEGTRKRTVATSFNRGVRRASFEQISPPPPVKAEFDVPAGVQDGLATLYALRGRAFKAGEHFTVPVVDEGMLYSVGFDVTGPEPIKVPLGEMNAWRLGITIRNAGGEPVGKNIATWISSDARRLPLKLQADLPVGSFILVLRTAQ